MKFAKQQPFPTPKFDWSFQVETDSLLVKCTDNGRPKTSHFIEAFLLCGISCKRLSVAKNYFYSLKQLRGV